MAKLLVLGGSGFIGRHICQFAVARGHQVVSVTRSGAPERVGAWVKAVTWVAADIFEPDLWRTHLLGCEAVAHAVGLYKERPAQGLTFSRILADSAIVAADEAERASTSTFIFVSTKTTPPGADKRFIQEKRRAERDITARALRSVILRPSLVYGVQQPVAALVGLGIEAARLLPGVSVAPPMSVTTLAQAAVSAVESRGVSGVQRVHDIQALAALGS